jgi:methylated-DNA-[protein]-cysteine S-methyltransferase
MQKAIKYTIFKTKWGYFGLVGTEYALCRTHLPSPKPAVIKSRFMKDLLLENRESSIEFDETFFKEAQEQIIAYFEGACVNFKNIPIVLDGFSSFFCSVLTACRNIGFGRTATYSGLAIRMSRPNAARAVGGALAKNPLPLIIPCHRIVCSDDKIGGFSAPGGTTLKRKMLLHEKHHCQ